MAGTETASAERTGTQTTALKWGVGMAVPESAFHMVSNIAKSFERCALQFYGLVQSKEKWVGYNVVRKSLWETKGCTMNALPKTLESFPLATDSSSAILIGQLIVSTVKRTAAILILKQKTIQLSHFTSNERRNLRQPSRK
uniref:Uncharacterized protein n=1 Tax=Romanomermis culicivorax TaxID=13658 RepID=A0A915L4R9_ROMCU